MAQAFAQLAFSRGWSSAGDPLGENGRIASVRAWRDVPLSCVLRDFGDHVLLPGLVDSHVTSMSPAVQSGKAFGQLRAQRARAA